LLAAGVAVAADQQRLPGRFYSGNQSGCWDRWADSDAVFAPRNQVVQNLLLLRRAAGGRNPEVHVNIAQVFAASLQPARAMVQKFAALLLTNASFSFFCAAASSFLAQPGVSTARPIATGGGCFS